MIDKKLIELFEDDKFILHTLELETPEEVAKAFADRGVELTLDVIKALGEYISRSNDMCDEDLDGVTGGYVFLLDNNFGDLQHLVGNHPSVTRQFSQRW